MVTKILFIAFRHENHTGLNEGNQNAPFRSKVLINKLPSKTAKNKQSRWFGPKIRPVRSDVSKLAARRVLWSVAKSSLASRRRARCRRWRRRHLCLRRIHSLPSLNVAAKFLRRRVEVASRVQRSQSRPLKRTNILWAKGQFRLVATWCIVADHYDLPR